jgi:hypothetical protein
MVATLYSLSLRTLTWSLLWPLPSLSNSTNSNPDSLDDDINNWRKKDVQEKTEAGGPMARYFHSAEAWEEKIIIFAGEGYSTSTSESGEAAPLCTLDDLWIWDTTTNRWEEPAITCSEGVERPLARYAHLSVLSAYSTNSSRSFEPHSQEKEGEGIQETKSVLIILGGQDINNTYLSGVSVLDLNKMEWVKTGRWEKHIGTYRAVAISAALGVVAKRSTGGNLLNSIAGSMAPVHPTMLHQSHSRLPTVDRPEPIFIFSNYNFNDVRRDLDILSTPLAPAYDLESASLTRQMSDINLPPGLRFPTGTIIGQHLFIFGTNLSPSSNGFAIWSLNLGSDGGAGVARSGEEMKWSRIDPGSVLSRGSWNRAARYGNKIVILGDRERDITVDYDHRQVSQSFQCNDVNDLMN